MKKFVDSKPKFISLNSGEKWEIGVYVCGGFTLLCLRHIMNSIVENIHIYGFSSYISENENENYVLKRHTIISRLFNRFTQYRSVGFRTENLIRNFPILFWFSIWKRNIANFPGFWSKFICVSGNRVFTILWIDD